MVVRLYYSRWLYGYNHIRPFWTSRGEVTFLAQRLRSFSWGERCRRKPSPSWAWTICCVPLLKTWAKTWQKKPGKPGLGGFGIRQTNLGIFGIQSAQSRILAHPISSRYQMAQSPGNWRLHLLFHDVIAEGPGRGAKTEVSNSWGSIQPIARKKKHHWPQAKQPTLKRWSLLADLAHWVSDLEK